MAKAHRLEVKKEPVLHLHRYIVAVHNLKRGWNVKYKYAASKQEVQKIRDAAKKGSLVEVFSAAHNFKEAWVIS